MAKIDVVIAHYNNPHKLDYTLKLFKERESEHCKFYLIDNSSAEGNVEKCFSVLSKNVSNFEIIQRENKNKEAGAYWYYIENCSLAEETIVFTQEELHEFPMAPKGKVSTEKNPFYPHFYGENGISLNSCNERLLQNPFIR